MVARRLVRCTCGPGRCCRTSGPGGRKRWVTTTAGTARRSGSTGIVTITIGSRTCRYPLPWAVTVDDSPRPKIRDGQESNLVTPENEYLFFHHRLLFGKLSAILFSSNTCPFALDLILVL